MPETPLSSSGNDDRDEANAPHAKVSDQLLCFTAVELSAQQAEGHLVHQLNCFGPVKQVKLTGIHELIAFITPLKSFTTRFAGVEDTGWTFLVSDMKGESCHVDGYALSRATGCRAAGVVIWHERRELHLYEHGRKIREIQSLLDGNRWYYRETGNSLPFENAAEGSKRRKCDRLSVEILKQYFEAFTQHSIPAWKTFVHHSAFGLQRSLHELRSPVVSFPTDASL